MEQISFFKVYADGDLMKRASQSFSRLECEEYHVENIFKKEYNWPADFEGRTILSLTMLAQSTHKKPKYLAKIMELLPSHLNEKGYFGKILPAGFVDEQQLSGHSWFLKAMVEYYLWKKDENVLTIIRNVVRNLLLPAKGCYKKYPVNPKDRVCDGEAIGSLYKGTVENWHLSSDVGCAFIMLDGATHAYELLKDPELKVLIDEMIEKFLSIDIYGLSFQTHATLSACRAILCFYESVGVPKYLGAVENIFSLYLKEGITENYENYNWFQRPEWTEPCAVIDSFILSVDLWKNTGKPEYLDTAHNIFYNGLGYGQRPNGGFGCNICSGAKDEFLSPKEGLFEAFWCCTMRGGDGLSRAIGFSYFTEEDSVIVPFYNNNTANLAFSDGNAVIKQTTGFPIAGNIKIEVVYSYVVKDKTVKMFIPTWVDKDEVKLFINDKRISEYKFEAGFLEVQTELLTGLKIELNFGIGLRKVMAINRNSIQNCYSLHHGFLMLGIENLDAGVSVGDEKALEYLGDGKYKIPGSDSELSPINDMINKSEEAAKANKKQVLFQK